MKVKIIKTRYWLPGEDYLKSISDSTQKVLMNNDIIVISEKALSVAKGYLIDEDKIKPSLLAKLLAKVYMRFIWGYFLGNICNFKEETIKRLRTYPLEEGAKHKQVVLRYFSFLQALKYGSEGGIDLSNVPFSYACLPLRKPLEEAEHIRSKIEEKTRKKITIIIADTDSTFSYHNFHFTSRSNPIYGIKSFGGIFFFIIGRALKLKQRATPLALVGSEMNIEKILNLVEIAHHSRGSGAGRTVWDMRRKFRVNLTKVTWKMLETVDHFPIVLIRK